MVVKIDKYKLTTTKYFDKSSYSEFSYHLKKKIDKKRCHVLLTGLTLVNIKNNKMYFLNKMLS